MPFSQLTTVGQLMKEGGAISIFRFAWSPVRESEFSVSGIFPESNQCRAARAVIAGVDARAAQSFAAVVAVTVVAVTVVAVAVVAVTVVAVAVVAVA